jgi:hypothetical protein
VLASSLTPKCILMNTRWHEEDVAGRVLEQIERKQIKGRVISILAIAEADDPLGRAPGDYLWDEPNDYNYAAFLRARHRETSPMMWAALSTTAGTRKGTTSRPIGSSLMTACHQETHCGYMADLIMLLPRMAGIILCMWLSGWIPLAVCMCWTFGVSQPLQTNGLKPSATSSRTGSRSAGRRKRVRSAPA